ERTIYDVNGTHPNDAFIDLDSGKLFSESDLETISPEKDLWRGKANIDLMGDPSGQTVFALGLVVLTMDEKFDSPTAERVAADKRLTVSSSENAQEVKTPKELPATYLFRTREGARGVLEVVRYNNDYESMDIRYRLVRAQREFEPLTVVLLPSAAGSKRFLNLTDTKFYSEIPATDPVAYLEHDSKDGWRLIIEGIYNYHTEPEKGAKLWESMPAEEIAQPAGLAAVPFEQTGFYRVRSQDLPSVVLIPQWGLFRIAAFDDRTTTLMIEYK